MAVLGRVVSAPTPGQGRDVVHQVCVPEHWLRRGNVLSLTLPRLLRCAACDGGGCDHCERQGALALRPREAPADVVRVELSQDMDPRHVIRVPERGACAPSDPGARGCLLLRFSVGEPAPGVELETAETTGVSPAKLRWGFVVVLLAAGFGWWAAGGAW